MPAVPGDVGTPLTNAQVVEVVAQARGALVDKSLCASDWRDFYHDLKKSLKGEK